MWKLAGSRRYFAAPGQKEAQIELTHNWDAEELDEGRNFGHLAYEVDDIYATCQKLMDAGVTINRPPRDGRMALCAPDNISVELLQAGGAQEPCEPWASMKQYRTLVMGKYTLPVIFALLLPVQDVMAQPAGDAPAHRMNCAPAPSSANQFATPIGTGLF